jgi:phenylalanyl-tRNA synthetase beta subunit
MGSNEPENNSYSIALRLELLDEMNPLTDERVAVCVEQILMSLDNNLGVRLRG